MKLEDLGYTERLERAAGENRAQGLGTARVLAEHRERYIVRTADAELQAEITGNLRFSAGSREDLPVVGDWVACMQYETDLAVIHRVLPRASLISRQAVGKYGEKQPIAANIDIALLLQAVDRDFNMNRLERYLTLCYASKVRPVIVLTKIDLADRQRREDIMKAAALRFRDLPLFAVSNTTGEGYEALRKTIRKGKTYCLLGSSGVGKSSMINRLSGRERMRTDAISASTQKGRHVTSHRELIVLDSGGILIDNPGMREIGIADAGEGLESTFNTIMQLSQHCRFRDCTHAHEDGCAVIEAVEKGDIERCSYENFLKMEREKEHFNRSAAEKRRKDKAFGKMLKNYKDDMRKINPKHKIDYKK